MNASLYTPAPAPWVATGSETTLATWVKDAAGKRVCTMRQCESDWDSARLIAAAPDLLTALEEMVRAVNTTVNLVEMTPQGRERLAAAQKAIAKARGQS